MEFIKNVFGNKKNIGILSVCILVLSLVMVGAVTGNTYAADTSTGTGSDVGTQATYQCWQCNSYSTVFKWASSQPSSDNDCSSGYHPYSGASTEVECTGMDGDEIIVKKVYASFNSNGGTPTYSKKSCDIDVSAGKSSCTISVSSYNPTRTGHTFKGWDESTSCSSPSKNYIVLDSDRTVYACWDAISVKVTFDGNGGTLGGAASTLRTISYGGSYLNAIDDVDFVRTGYKFAGWYTAANGGSELTSSSTVSRTSAHSVYAHWTGNTYTVSFYDDSGNKLSDKTVTYDSEYGALPTPPAKSGYIFKGWRLGSALGDLITSSTTVSYLGNHKLFATYDVAPSVTVSYFSNGASHISYSTATLPVGSKYTFPSVTKTGYSFDEWYDYDVSTSTWGTTKITTDTVVKKTTNHTVGVKWKANTYSVVYDGNKSTSGSMENSSHTYDVAKALTSNSFKRTNYDFTGWNTQADGKGTSYIDEQSVKNLTATNNGSVILYAQWDYIGSSGDENGGDFEGGTPTTVKYSVVYNANGGTGSMSSSSHTYGTSKALTINTFSRVGYIFDKWNTKADGSGTSFTDGESVKNLTSTNGDKVNLYAQWKPNTYTVKYNGNGNTSGTTADSSHTYGVDASLTKNGFVKTDYTFKCWNTKADGTGINYIDSQSVKDLTSDANGTITLYAIWQANDANGGEEQVISYTIKYNANGGTGTMNDSSHTYGYASNLSPNKFTRIGCLFVGWNTKIDGSGTSYSDGQTISNLASTNGAVVTLYAQWTIDQNNNDDNGENDNNNEESTTSELSAGLSLIKSYTNKLDVVVEVSNLKDGETATCEVWLIDDDNQMETVATIDNCKNGKNYATISNLKADTSYTLCALVYTDEDVYFTDEYKYKTAIKNIDKSPETGVFATILVSLIGMGALGGVIYYRKKIKA